jgi:mannosyltransferase
MKPRYQIILVLLLALVLRLITIGTRAMWYDEAFAVLFAEKGLQAMLYGTLTPVNGAAADVHPLLYYTTLNFWMGLFGQDAATVRLYSVLISLITLLVFYALLRDLFDHRTALAGMVIAAVAPFYVQYSQEARMYAILALLMMLATWCYVRGSRDEGRGANGWWVGLAVCAGLGMYAQQLAAFYLFALGLHALSTRKRAIILKMGAAAIGAGVIYLPWLLQLPSQLGKLGAYWIDRPGIAQLLLTLRSFLFAELEPNPVAQLVTLILFVLILLFLIYMALKPLSRPHRDRGALILILWLVFVPIAAMWLVSQVRPVYLPRALLPSGLMLYAALAWLFTRARLAKPIRGLLVGATVVSFAFGLHAFYTWNTFPRGDFRGVIASINQQRQAGDQVVHANKITALPFYYYDRALPMRYIADPVGGGSDTLARPTQETLKLFDDPCIGAAVSGAARVWYIKYEQQGDADLPWLRAHFREVQQFTSNDLTVTLFDTPDSPTYACTP